ncbi:MAG TPA: tetratricopeptide repeat protein [Alphaproteobacteria bacterium]
MNAIPLTTPAAASCEDVVEAVDRQRLAGNHAAALALCRQILSQAPRSAAALVRVAIIAAEAGDAAQAKRMLSALPPGSDDDYDFQLALAEAFLRLGRPDDAVRFLEWALVSADRAGHSTSAHGESVFARRIAATVGAVRPMLDRSAPAEARIRLIRSLFRCELEAEAVAECLKAIDFAPPDQDLALDVAYPLIQRGRYDAARTVLERVRARGGTAGTLKLMEAILFLADRRLGDGYDRLLEHFGLPKLDPAAPIEPWPRRVATARRIEGPIVIATSLMQRRLETQRRAVASWRAAGCEVISLNVPEEAAALRPEFPDVRFVTPPRTAIETLGRPYVYIVDLLRAARDAGGAIVGVINSDIVLEQSNLVEVVRANVGGNLLLGKRFDVPAVGRGRGTVNESGFDLFFMDAASIDLIPSSDMLLGMPWWDYWLPLTAQSAGLGLVRLDGHFAVHEMHPASWMNETFTRTGLEWLDAMVHGTTGRTSAFYKAVFDLFSSEAQGGASEASRRRRFREFATFIVELINEGSVKLPVSSGVVTSSSRHDEASAEPHGANANLDRILQAADRLRLRGNHVDAFALYRQASDLAPGDPAVRLRLAIMAGLGKRHAVARQLLDSVSALPPDRLDLHLARGEAELALGRYDVALDLFDAATASPELRGRAHYGAGDALRGLKRDDEAICRYRASIAEGYDPAQAYKQLAACLGRLGRTEEAETALREAVAADPEDPIAQCQLADLLIRSKRPGEARELVEHLHRRWGAEYGIALLKAHLLLAEGRDDDSRRMLLTHLGQPDQTIFADPIEPAALDAVQPTNDRIVVATSLMPRRIGSQRRAVASWRAAGLEVVSLNTPDEIGKLASDFPDVTFVPAERTAASMAGRPLVYITDMLRAATASGAFYVGLINSDIVLTGQNIPALVRENCRGRLLFGSRFDITGQSDERGTEYPVGFDVFFLEAAAAARLGEARMVVGMPWWDFWLPLAAREAGMELVRLTGRFAIHEMHPVGYSPDLWVRFGELCFEELSAMRRRHGRFFRKLLESLNGPPPANRPAPDRHRLLLDLCSYFHFSLECAATSVPVPHPAAHPNGVGAA